jgi:hypothetical protein
MKTVFSPSQCIHVWAQQTQEHGKAAKGSCHFNGGFLYSYGSHYVTGYIMRDGVALHNDSSNSKTTNKQRGEAWHATSHRVRYSLPDLTGIASTIATLEIGSDKGKQYARDAIKKYVAGNALEITCEAGEYLLRLAGEKNPQAAFTRARKAATVFEAKEKAAEIAGEKKTRLALASRVSAICKTEKTLVQGLASCMGAETYNLERHKTDLHNAHRAAKAAKREKQARDVWRVLGLVKAELAHRAKCEGRKNANAYLRNNIVSFRSYLRTMGRCTASGDVMRAYDLGELSNKAEEIAKYLPKHCAPLALRLKTLAEALDAQYETQQAAEHAARERKERERAANWLAGLPGAQRPSSEVTLLRATGVTRDASGEITGGTLETSRGADVPLCHAVRAFRFIKLCRERNAAANAQAAQDGHAPIDVIAWQRNGHSVRVGHFTIDTIWASGNFRAGCHSIKWPETERLARALGIFETAGDDSALIAA